jgi:N-acetylmuramoyl-L-alanine amidase
MEIIEKLLTPNKYSRPNQKRKSTKAIVVHWIGNPMTSAMSNRNWFESLKNGSGTFASAQEIIGLEGEVVICLPKDEMAYHVGSKTYTKEALKRLGTYPNNCTYGIECCHLDWNGKMTDATYNSLVDRCATLCKEFQLDPLKDLWLHQEVVGWKDCHRWFVNHPEDWQNFKNEVKTKMEEKQMKDYKEILKEKTDSPDVWIKLCDDLENGYIELENIQTLQWLKVLVEKLGN